MEADDNGGNVHGRDGEDGAIIGTFRVVPLTVPDEAYGDYEGTLIEVADQMTEYLRQRVFRDMVSV